MLALDILRASLGPALTTPYERAFGAVPALTAGTLSWPAALAPGVLAEWDRWSAPLPARVLTAIRLGEAVVAIDVAQLGDPWGVGATLAPLRELRPEADNFATVVPRDLRAASGAVAAAALPLERHPRGLLTLSRPGDPALGLRRAGAGLELIGLAPAPDAAPLRAAVARAAGRLAAGSLSA